MAQMVPRIRWGKGRSRFNILFSLAYLPFLAQSRGYQPRKGLAETHHSGQHPGPVIVNPPKDIQPRLNLLDILDNPELMAQKDLLLQAYVRLQDRPTSSPVSYFQIAGIHGMPYQSWDGVVTGDPELSGMKEPFGGITPGVMDNFAGYCWHASILFPTWHRAYTMLMEQEMRVEAARIAQEYNETARPVYIEAADKLRMPFWEWDGQHASDNGLPVFILQKEVEINSPQGLKTLPNPLESYTFQGDVMNGNAGVSRGADLAEGKQIGYAPSLYGHTTIRHPDIYLEADLDSLQNDLRMELKAFVRPAWNAMLRDPEVEQSWARFSTHKPRKDGLRPDSNLLDIEGLHDHIHDVAGGIVFVGDQGYPGHFSDTNIAAYDPIFFMHHANVDRLTALYQRRNPDTWIQPTHERHVKNYMVGLHGFNSSSSTPLWPFRKTKDSFYTSDDVREFTSLGYTYPEFMDELTNTLGEAGLPPEDLQPVMEGRQEQEFEIEAEMEAEMRNKNESAPTSWNLFSKTGDHLAKVTHLLRGGANGSREDKEQKKKVFHHSFWCPHSKLGWCHHSAKSNYTANETSHGP